MRGDAAEEQKGMEPRYSLWPHGPETGETEGESGGTTGEREEEEQREQVEEDKR